MFDLSVASEESGLEWWKEKRRGSQRGKTTPFICFDAAYELSINKHMFHKSTYERRSYGICRLTGRPPFVLPFVLSWTNLFMWPIFRLSPRRRDPLICSAWMHLCSLMLTCIWNDVESRCGWRISQPHQIAPRETWGAPKVHSGYTDDKLG